jgi:hypothetical protein
VEAAAINKIVLILSTALLGSVNAWAQGNESVYTNLDGKQCRTLKSAPSGAGSYVGQCPGIAGYTLLVEEDDVRQNITVVTPRGQKHSLNLWEVISPAFSNVGQKAEWRVNKAAGKPVPVALIVRFSASEDAANPEKKTSYLGVAKITSREICVTNKILPGAKANEEARRAADEAANKPCLKNPK